MGDDIKNHFGHKMEIGIYGPRSDPNGVSVECMDCCCVIIELYDALTGLNITK